MQQIDNDLISQLDHDILEAETLDAGGYDFNTRDMFRFYEYTLATGYFLGCRVRLSEMNIMTEAETGSSMSSAPNPVMHPETEGVECKICGIKRNTLKRHLRASHGLEEDQYKAQFPEAKTVSDAYSALRSNVATQMKLGH